MNHSDTLAEATMLAKLINSAISVLQQNTDDELPTVGDDSHLSEVDEIARRVGVTVESLLTSAVLLSVRANAASRSERNRLSFIVADKRPPAELRYTPVGAPPSRSLTADQIKDAMISANRALELIHDLSEANNAPVFRLLGLRNLSGFVGEVFASELYRLNEQQFLPNPNQDGYPDLLAKTPEGIRYIVEKERLNQTSDKQFWSPYPHGGVEVKATCGNTPVARILAKPKIGELRRNILMSADWKAHHRGTNNLIGVYWDFVDGLPTLLAAFYRNNLTENDWGNMVLPKKGKGNVTSVSVMKRGSKDNIVGVKKMGKGWIVLPDDVEMRRCLCQNRIYMLSTEEIRAVTSSTIERHEVPVVKKPRAKRSGPSDEVCLI